MTRLTPIAAVEALRAETELRRESENAIAAIRARLPGASPGQLALAEEAGGAVSLAGEGGEVSLAQHRKAEKAS